MIAEFPAGTLRKSLAVFAIEQVAHCFPPRFVRFACRFTLGCIHRTFGGWFFRFRSTAGRASIGKTGLIGPEFELLRTDNADFDWKAHTSSIVFRLGTKNASGRRAKNLARSRLKHFQEDLSGTVGIQRAERVVELQCGCFGRSRLERFDNRL